jgi:hypothetical protein
VWIVLRDLTFLSDAPFPRLPAHADHNDSPPRPRARCGLHRCSRSGTGPAHFTDRGDP